jgi:glutathione S-transferase
LSNIKLYHCQGARSLRPLWALEELGLPYEPILLPFPPRALAREFLDINPIGTIPFLIDGDVRMTESTGICLYLATRYGPTDLAVSPEEADYSLFLNWLFFSDATLAFPQTIVLRYRYLEAPENRAEKPAADYEKWFAGRLRTVESALTDREWLCAGCFTIADVAIAYSLYLADRVVGVGEHFGPNVTAYFERACARPAFQRACIVDAEAPSWH